LATAEADARVFATEKVFSHIEPSAAHGRNQKEKDKI